MHPALLLGLGGAVAWSLRQRSANRAVRDLRALLSVEPRPRALESLPEPVRAVAERAVRDRSTIPRVVRLEQRGDLRLKVGGPWVPFDAVEHLAVGHVAYAWRARLALGHGLVRTESVDTLAHGAGRLETRLFGVLPAWDRGGAPVTRAQTLRYLSLLPWVPYAFFANPFLQFRTTPTGVLEVVTERDPEAALRLDIDSRGDVLGLRGLRPRGTTSGTRDEPWGVEFGGHGTLDGLRIPRQMEVRWEGEPAFVHCRARITAMSRL
jgi:hypothetical protein